VEVFMRKKNPRKYNFICARLSIPELTATSNKIENSSWASNRWKMTCELADHGVLINLPSSLSSS